MASTHVTDTDIERFRRRQMPGDALVAFGEHLAVCDDCRTRTRVQSDATAALLTLHDELGGGEDDHLAESEIRAFVDDDVAPERRAEIVAHLAECPACADDVRDLSEFAAAFHRSTRLRRRWTYGAFAAAAVLVLAVGGVMLRRAANTSSAATLAGSQRAGSLEPADAARVREALESGRLSLPSTLSDLTGRGGVLMGTADAPAFHLTAPIATVVLETRPTLRWTASSGSTYVVTLQEQASGDIISSPPLQRTEWTPTQALGRGRTYAWQVAATAGGKEVVAPPPSDPPAQFMIADASAAGRLEHLPPSPLVRGVLYASAGLLDDAERELEMIGAADQDAARAAGFLAQLRQARAAPTR